LDGRRANKESDWLWYAETRDKAKSLMVSQYRSEVERARKNLEGLEKRLKNAEQL